MSAIFGMIRLDGSAVDDEALRRMSNHLSHRGPDGCGAWRQGPVALGHRMLHTTPESLRERQPIVRHEGSLVLVADARVDNREDLISALGLSGPATTSPTDADLIVRSYERWGEQCAERIIGDFAFAIWDDRRGSLFCARDPMGVRPFYYYLSSDVFVFASEIKALRGLPEVPLRINELQVAYYLEPYLDDREITFYDGIRRLPAAHAMRAGRGACRPWRYWRLDIEREIVMADDRDYADAFLELFTSSVRARTRSALPVGSTVSGGLDSSSIACVARATAGDTHPGPLHTFSAIFPGLPDEERRMADESDFIEAVISTGGFMPHYVRADELSPFHAHDRMLWHLDEPALGYSMYMHWGLYESARNSGVRVFLDGLDGDGCVSHGFERFSELIYRGEWDAFEVQVRALGRAAADPSQAARRTAYQFISPYLDALADVGDASTWFSVAGEAARRFGISRRRLVGRHGLRRLGRKSPLSRLGRSPAGTPRGALVHPSLADRIRSADYRPAAQPNGVSSAQFARHAHRLALESPVYQSALETTDRVAAAFQIEARYPFFDRRLMEFCVALPSSQKLDDGWTRVVLRRAMEGVLPPFIQWRPGKQDLAPNFARGLRTRDDALVRSAVENAPRDLHEIVDAAAAADLYERYTSTPIREAPELDGCGLFRLTMLSRWLAGARLDAAPGDDRAMHAECALHA